MGKICIIDLYHTPDNMGNYERIYIQILLLQSIYTTIIREI